MNFQLWMSTYKAGIEIQVDVNTRSLCGLEQKGTVQKPMPDGKNNHLKLDKTNSKWELLQVVISQRITRKKKKQHTSHLRLGRHLQCNKLLYVHIYLKDTTTIFFLQELLCAQLFSNPCVMKRDEEKKKRQVIIKST